MFNILNRKKHILSAFFLVLLSNWYTISQDNNSSLSQDSEKFLMAVKNRDNQKIQKLKDKFTRIDFKELHKTLKNDEQKKAFWINIYNAFIIYQLRNDASLYDDRGDFFSTKSIEIAGEEMSFDFIEHGILRRSKAKLSLGFFGKLFPSRVERKLRVDELDYRIHFALNCGAKACPPVRIYSAEKVEEELAKAEKHFVSKVTKYKEEAQKVITTSIFSWFRGDFGNKKGIREIIRRYLDIPNDRFEIEFRKYDWTIDINNFEVDE